MNGARVGVRDWAVGVGIAAILLIAGLSDPRPATAPVVIGDALLAAGGLALAARRRAPVAVLVVTGLCAVGYQAAGFDVSAVAYLIAVYAAVRAGHRVRTVAVERAHAGRAAARGRGLAACTTRARRSRRPGACSSWPG